MILSYRWNQIICILIRQEMSRLLYRMVGKFDSYTLLGNSFVWLNRGRRKRMGVAEELKINSNDLEALYKQKVENRMTVFYFLLIWG